MHIKEPLKNIVRLEQVFAQAIVQGDKKSLLNILSDYGEFHIQDENLDTVEVNKLIFIDWILKKREETKELTYYFDQCTHCKIGNPGIIFNDGSFPKKPKDLSEKVKTGLMFVINNNKIVEIIFCGSFINTDNEWLYVQETEKDLQKYMLKKGLNREQALKEIKGNVFWVLEVVND